MNLSEMNLEAVEARLAELVDIVKNAEDVETIDTATEEKRSLLERKAELEDLEARKADAMKLEAEEVTGQTKEKRKNEMEELRYSVESPEYRKAWLEYMQGKAINEEARAAITASDAIPTQTLNMVINRLKENALLQYLDIWNIPGNVKIPVYTTDNDATWTTTSTDSEDVIGSISLTPFQLIKTLEVSGAVDKMSIDAFEDAIVNALSNKLASALQKAALVGSGSANSQPTGIVVTHSTADGTFTKAAISKADLLKIMGKLPAKFQDGAVWVMPNHVFFECMAIANIEGFAGVSAGMQKQIGGKPVVVDDSMIISSTDTILYGQPKAYHYNLGQAPTIDKDLSVGFRSNSAVYRGVLQADGKLDDAAAFVKYTRAT